jgi:prevent-host-death family protein
MSEVGIRALKQNASAVVSAVEAGDSVVITDRGRPVALMTPIPTSRIGQLITSGRARPPKRSITEIDPPVAGPSLSTELERMRNDERY